MADEKILIEIEVDVQGANTSIDELRKKQQQLKKEFETAKVGSDAYKGLQKELTTTNTQIKVLSDSVKAQSGALGGVNQSAQFTIGSFGELRQRITALKKEQDRLVIGSDEFIRNQHELSAALNEEIAIRGKQPSLFKERIKSAIDESSALKNLTGAFVSNNKEAAAVKGVYDQVANAGKLVKDVFASAGKQAQETGQAFGSISKGVESTKEAFAGSKKNIDDTKKAFEGLDSGVETTGKGLSNFNKVLALSGIGLLIAAFASLIAYFKRTDEGQEKLERGMAAFGAIVDVVIGRVIDFGKFLVSAFENPKKALSDFADLLKQFVLDRFNLLISGVKGLGEAINLVFSGQFKKAAEVAGKALLDINRGINPVAIGIELVGKAAEAAVNSISKIAAEAFKAAEAAAEIRRQQQELEDIERELSVINAQREGEIARLIIAAKDRTKADQERINLLKEAGAIEEQQSKDAISIALQKLDLIKQENKLKENSGQLTDDLKDKEAAAQIEVIRLQNASLELRERIANRLAALDSEIASDREKAEADRIKKAKEAQEQLLKDEADYQKRSMEEFRATQDEINNVFDERIIKQKEALAEGLTSEEDYAEFSIQNENDRLEALTTAYEDYGQNTIDIRNEIADNEVEAARKEAKAAAKAEKDKQQARTQTLDFASNVFSNLASMAEEGSAEAKALAVTAATIDTISSTIKAYNAGLTLPAPAPAPQIFAVVSAVAAAAFGAANIAKIASAEKGGIVWEKAERGKMFELGGNLHTNGGTKFIGSDGTKFEAEKGEVLAVVNRRSVGMLKGLSNWNEAGGGRKFYDSNVFADGGLVAQELTTNALANVPSASDIDIPQATVSVKDISKVTNKVTVIQSKKSL